jgi:hypothetical protein
LRIGFVLAATLLCGFPLLDSNTSQAASSTSSVRARCVSSKEARTSSTVCEYRFEQPFLVSGYSSGGQSTLSYSVQCGKDSAWPVRKEAIEHRAWYRRSLTVRGNFKILGGKGAPPAARRCDAARGKAALLSVTLTMSRGVTKTNLVVRLDSSLPWGR